MNDKPVATLRKLVQEYGSDLTTDARRTEALLNDLCPSYRREVFVLINAQRQQVPADLVSAPQWMPADAVAGRISRRLQDRLALSEEAADWAVESWATALELRQNRSGVGKLMDRTLAAMFQSPSAKSSGPKQRQTGQVVVQSPEAVDSQTTKALVAASSPANVTEKLAAPIRIRRYTWLASGVTIVALLWLSAASTASWQVISSIQGQFGSPSRIVEREYALPRIAWVSDGPLLVRKGPGISEDTLALLQVGVSVQVTEYSNDMQWSHIVEPENGWVSNWYLNFLASGDSNRSVQLLHQEMRTAMEDAPIHTAPDISSEIETHLAANIPVVTIAVTADGQWRQTTKPVPGWMASHSLLPD